MTPRVSVVIPIFREGFLLEHAICSVLEQTFQNFELILVDNNATEETRRMAESYVSSRGDKVRLIQEKVQGACSARNKGILNAKGTYIALLDGDDIMKPERLERQLMALENQKDVSLVSCHHDVISHDGKEIIQRNIPELSYSSKNVLELKRILRKLFEPLGLHPLETFDLFSAPFLFFRKADAIKAGLFDVRMNPRDKDDWEFCMRMFTIGKFSHLPEVLQFYRSENLHTRAYKLKDMHQKKTLLQEQKFIGILWERFGAPFPQNHQIFKHLMAFTLKRFGCYLMGFSQGKPTGKEFLNRAIKYDPWDTRSWKFLVKAYAPGPLHPRLFEFDSERHDQLDFDEDFSRSYLEWPPSIPSTKTKIDPFHDRENQVDK